MKEPESVIEAARIRFASLKDKRDFEQKLLDSYIQEHGRCLHFVDDALLHLENKREEAEKQRKQVERKTPVVEQLIKEVRELEDFIKRQETAPL